MRQIKLLAFLWILLTGARIQASVISQSPFNHFSIQCGDSSFSFLVSGHFYGSSASRSGFPAATLLGNLDTLNSVNASFLVCLGDLFPSLDQSVLSNYDRSFFSKIRLPVLNAPGNHDHMSGDYEQLFGRSYGYFECGTNLFILLDTEKDNGSVSGEQLSMLREQLKRDGFGNIFIFSHRTVWDRSEPEFSSFFNDNTRSVTGNNFNDDIRPALFEEQTQANIFWFSGSLGNAPASFFYHKNAHVTYIATAIRDLPRDAVLLINVEDNMVNFETISLTAASVSELETYNADFWQAHQGVEKPFNYRMLPYLTKKTVLSSAFWWGAGSVLMFILIVAGIRKFTK